MEKKEKSLEELDKIREALINSSSPEDMMDDGSDNCDVANIRLCFIDCKLINIF
jgi:hypothetical protein